MPVSLSGLDLSFLRKNDPNGVRAGSWRWSSKAQKFVTHDEWRRLHPPSEKRSDVPTPYFMPDVDSAYGGAWKSIIDGSEISSRSNWREHDKRNEVINVGTDFWAKDGDDAAYTREKMDYDPSLIGESEVFSWKTPQNLK